MSHKRKWLPAEPVISLDDIAREARENGRWIFWGYTSKPFHPRVVASWQLSMTANLVERGFLVWGSINPDYVEPKGGPKPWGGKRKRGDGFGQAVRQLPARGRDTISVEISHEGEMPF